MPDLRKGPMAQMTPKRSVEWSTTSGDQLGGAPDAPYLRGSEDALGLESSFGSVPQIKFAENIADVM